MHAIRHDGEGQFRRGGLLFHHDKWVVVDQPTPEQLAEPRLEIVEDVDGYNDHRLRGLPVVDPGDLGETTDWKGRALAAEQQVQELIAQIEALTSKSVSTGADGAKSESAASASAEEQKAGEKSTDKPADKPAEKAKS